MNLIGIKDLPISTASDESLGVLPYIESLSEFIITCDTPMTISIQGDWGSGKTSAMNMIREWVADNVIPVWFNTWQFSQFDMQSELSISLISYFVGELDDKESEFKKKIGGLLKGLGKMTAAVVAEHTIGETIAGKIADTQADSIDSAKVLKTLKTELQNVVEQKIKKSGKDRVVVFLDDLDRLSPEKAVELLEVLKNFLDIEGCVFVLAVDYSVVAQGIKKKLNTEELDEKGKSFFDKIIQLPFNMPIAQYNTETYCENLLKKINIDYDQKDISTYIGLANYSVGFNPRGLKRLFNLFQLLNIVAEKQDILEGDKAIKAEKQRMLFALLCMQSTFEPLYNFLAINSDDISPELIEMLSDYNKLREDAQLADFREKLKNANDATYKKISDFMEVFFGAIQLKSDGNDEKLSQDELEQLKMLLSFSSVTSTDLSTIQEANQGKKYNRVRLDSWNSFERNIKEIERKKNTRYKSLPFMKKLYDLTVQMIGDNLRVVFTEAGAMSFNSNNAKGRQKVFLYVDRRRKQSLPIGLYYPGKFSYKTIESDNDFDTWVPEEIRAAYDRFVANTKKDAF